MDVERENRDESEVASGQLKALHVALMAGLSRAAWSRECSYARGIPGAPRVRLVTATAEEP